MKVSEHNRALQEALGRAHGYLAIQSMDDRFYAPIFREYVKERYVVPGADRIDIKQEWTKCRTGRYCLGYSELFEVEPTISSMLITVLAARDPKMAANFVDRLERKEAAGKLTATNSYRSTSADPERASLKEQYPVKAQAGNQGKTTPAAPARESCEDVASRVYTESQTEKEHLSAPVFPCLREALSDATTPVALARFRMGIAHFLFHQKFQQQYPDDFEPGNGASEWMDSMAAPVLSSFNRDVASYLRHVREEILRGKERNEFASNGIVTLSTLSSIPSSVATQTNSEFQIPATFPLKDFLAGSAPGTAKPPAFLAANLAAGVAGPLAAGLALETAPAIATIGRNLNLIVTSNSLAGASAAELNINLISQDEAPPTVQRGSTSKTDTRSRVAKHNLQTVVRVDSLRLFELSAFSAELRRGGESIPIIPPYVELPVIGGLIRWPLAPARVYHASFAIVSAAVLPTSADLASSVRPATDAVVTRVEPKVTVQAPEGSTWTAEYCVVAKRQDTGVVAGRATVHTTPPTKESPVVVSWTPVGNDARYSVYRQQVGGRYELIEKDLTGARLQDDGTAGAPEDPPGKSDDAFLFRKITPALYLSPAVSQFHEAALRCIAEEAMKPNETPQCGTARLSAFASEN
jgi:hypothetical protein